jgi:hypothetical protein
MFQYCFNTEEAYQLFVDFKKAYDSVRSEVLYNILMEFGVPMKLVRLIRMCLNEIYIILCLPRVEAGKNTFTVIPASRKRRQEGNPVVSGETVPANLRKG